MIKLQFQYILSRVEGGINQSFVHWTNNYWVYESLEFELGLGYISEQYRQILCPHAANVLVEEDGNKYNPN